MWKEEKINRAALEAMKKVSAKAEPGDVIQWADLEKATGWKRHDSKFRSAVAKLRRDILKDRKIAVWHERGVGLKLLTPDETIHTQGPRRSRRASRQLTRGIREIESVDTESLPLPLRMLAHSQNNIFREQRRNLKRSAKEVQSVRDGSPLRPIPGTA